MNPEDFISFAARVVGYGPAGARSAVSRAYYGAFHTAVFILEELRCAPSRNATSHKLISEFLGCSSHVAARSAARLLSDLHSRRLRSDYRMADAGAESLEFAKLSVENAHDVRTHLVAFRHACDDPQLLDELRQEVARLKALRHI